MKWKWLFIVLPVLAATGIGLKMFVFNQKTVSVTSPTRRDAVRAIYATGSLRAEQKAVLRPEVGGTIKALNVKQGQEVMRGMLVMEIDVKEQNDIIAEQTSRVRETAVDLTRYQVDIDDAKSNYEKEQRLLEQGATTQQAVDDAKTRLDRAQASYGRASAAVRTARAALTTRKNMLGKGKINTPIDGVVTKLNVNLGDNVPANIDAVTIIDPLSFKVYADVDELDISRIRPGQEAYVAFDALPESRFKARVERIVPSADEVTKTLRVILSLIDVPLTVSDGLTATINIINDIHQNALTIPANTIVADSTASPRKANAAAVFVIGSDGVLERREIEVGIRGEDYVEVLNGLDEHDRLVLNPQPTWKNGDKVKVEQPTPAPASTPVKKP